MRALLILLTILPLSALAADTIWVANTAQGGDTGANAANAHSATWFNTAGNWGGGTASTIDAGDTVMLTGTIATALTVQASGATGNPITIAFDTGAKLSAAYWGTSGAINVGNKSNITVGGATQGTIESTANGTALANQVENYHVVIGYVSNVTVTNLTLTGMYVRTAGSSDSNTYGQGVRHLGASTNVTVTGCTMTDGRYGAWLAYQSGSTSANFKVQNCIISNTSTAVVFGSGGTSSELTGTNIVSGNTISGGAAWDGTWNAGASWHHIDGIHIWANQSSAIYGLSVYGNRIIGDFGTHASGWIYIDGSFDGIAVYNNLCAAQNGSFPSLGYVALRKSVTETNINAVIANNSVYGKQKTSGGGNGVYIDSATQVTIKNNILANCYAGLYCETAGLTASDYNLFDAGNVAYVPSSGFKASIATWRTYSGQDANSLSTTPGLTSPPTDLTITTSSAAYNVGTTLPQFSTDYLGTSRPQSLSWDIGAYEAIVSSSAVGRSSVKPRTNRIR